MKFNFFPIKRLFQVVFLALIAVFLTFDTHAAEDVNKRKKTKKEIAALYRICGGSKEVSYFRIAAFKKYPPFSWKVQDEKTMERKYEGFVPEAVHKALNDIGISKIHEQFYDSVDEMLQDAMLGRIDIIFTTFYDPKTIKTLDLIFPAYFGNPIGLISRKEDIVYEDQLSGKIGAIITTEGLNLMVSGMLPTDAKLVEVEDFNEAYKKLLSGEIDFIVAGKYAAMSEASALGIKDRITIPNENFKANKIFAGFSKVSRCHYFKEMFENAFKKYFEDKEASKNRMKKAIDDWAEYKKASGDLVEMPEKSVVQTEPEKVEEPKVEEVQEQPKIEEDKQVEVQSVEEQAEKVVEQTENKTEQPASVEQSAEPVAQPTVDVSTRRPPVFRKTGDEKVSVRPPVMQKKSVPTSSSIRPPVMKRPVENKGK